MLDVGGVMLLSHNELITLALAGSELEVRATEAGRAHYEAIAALGQGAGYFEANARGVGVELALGCGALATGAVVAPKGGTVAPGGGWVR